MDVSVTVSLNGVEEKLYELGPKLARSYLRKALKAAGTVWEKEAKARAPVDTGALRDSIHTVVTTSASQTHGVASVGPAYDTQTRKSGGDLSQDPGVYGKFVEFGVDSRHIRKQPFLRPAFDAKGDEVVKVFAETLADGLKEALK